MSQWADLKDEIQAYVNDEAFDDGGQHEGRLLTWANKVIERLCVILVIEEHYSSYTFPVTTAIYSQSLPEEFLKYIPDITRVRVGEDFVPIKRWNDIYLVDPTRADLGQTVPDMAAIKGHELHWYPKVTADLVLDNYQRKPTAMSGDTSEPDLPDAGSVSDIVDNLVIIGTSVRCFKWLRESDDLADALKEWSILFRAYKDWIENKAPVDAIANGY